MSYKELIASLRKEGEEKIRAVRSEAESEERKIRTDSDEKIRQLNEEFEREKTTAIRTQNETILSAAATKARTKILTAEQALSDRLFTRSLACLQEYREKQYENTFTGLVRELPSALWKEVRVNPADTTLAGTHFPDAVIIADNDIIGGFEVFTENRRQQILNTLEKRLERAWEDMLPFFISETYRETTGHGTPSKD